jgi:hypothetical protein
MGVFLMTFSCQHCGITDVYGSFMLDPRRDYCDDCYDGDGPDDEAARHRREVAEQDRWNTLTSEERETEIKERQL